MISVSPFGGIPHSIDASTWRAVGNMVIHGEIEKRSIYENVVIQTIV